MGTRNRIVGKKTLYDSTKDELVEFNIVEADRREGETYFHKLFLKSFIPALKPVADKKTQLCLWIIENINNSNLLLYTYRQIAAKGNFSYRLVADTMQKLMNTGFLCRHPSGGYMVNPDVIFRGGYSRRCHALKEYKECVKAEYGNTTDLEEIRLQNIQDNIAQLQKQKEKLQKNIDRKKSGISSGKADNVK